MREAVHVAGMGERRVLYGVWWGNQRERDRLEEPSVDGKKMEVH